MKIVKAGLQKLKPSDLVGKSEHVEGKMTGNMNFPTPSPSVADLTAARTALVTALAAASGGGHAAIAVKNDAAKHLAQLLTRMTRYVNSVAAGDVDKAVSSGFELAKRPDPIDHLDAPSKFEGRTAAIEGRVDLRWKGVHGGRMYFVYMSKDNGATWNQVGMASQGRFTVIGLVSGTFYSFRVSAVGSVGEGPVSETVVAKAA
ncbi:MAG: fibronectin type III domain-containing protein [Flavobacteriales bacterium]|nr:fibronectin type III domain-containing protein [Flavobacteriales bacterium]